MISQYSGSNDTEEKALLLSQLIKIDKNTSIKAATNVGVNVQRQLNAKETTKMISLLRMPMKKVRGIKTALKKLGVSDFLASEKQVRIEQSTKVDHLSSEVGRLFLETSKDKKEQQKRPFVRIKDLKQFLEDVVTMTLLEVQFNDTIWL